MTSGHTWPPAALYTVQYQGIVQRALAEDLGSAGDLTSDAVAPPMSMARGAVVLRGPGRVAGVEIALTAFRVLDPYVEIDVVHPDGSDAQANDVLALVRGRARALLSAERTVLNLLARLCGIATATRDVVASLRGLKAQVLCTRKTTPGLRALEKYAVRVGGGRNHRYGLHDAVLIKDNHRVVAGGVAEAVTRVRRAVGPLVKIEVEVDALDDLNEALRAKVDVVLLDNMGLAQLRQAVELARGRVLLEASGGITPENVRGVAKTGVDFLSMGWLTHSAPALDVTFDFHEGEGQGFAQK